MPRTEKKKENILPKMKAPQKIKKRKLKKKYYFRVRNYGAVFLVSMV